MSNTRRTVAGLVFALMCAYVTTPVTVTALDRPTALSILAPTQSQEVSGHVSFWAAAGVEGVVSLRFQVDGKDYGQPMSPGLYRVSWDSTKATDGLHTVQAIAQDQFGNTVLSPPVTFFVNNFAPSAPIPPPVPEPTPDPAAPPVPTPAPTATSPGPPTTAPARVAPVVGSAAAARRGAVPCNEPDPFKAEGGIGMCVGGEWVLLWKPVKRR